MIEIKSSLLNTKDFKKLKESLIKASEVDNKDKFRVKMIEYINDSSDTNNDIFFYDMLEFVRFLNPNSDAAAYTTPEHLIFMNAPKGGGLNVGESVRKWDFIYDHECLHQLWDTFAVGDKIKKEFGSYNHEILNIASDCVINDYLSFYRKKDYPEGIITPEYIKTEFGVEYDRKVDTQYTLYLKLNKVAEENQKMKDKMKDLSDKMDKQMGEGNPQEGQGQKGKEQEGKGKEGKDNKKGQGQGKENKKSQEGQDKEGQGQSQGQGKEDKEGKEGQGKENKKGQEGEEGNPNGWGDGTSNEENVDSEVDLKELKKRAEEIIEKYKNRISGDFGKFIKKCQVSQTLKKDGLVVKTQNKGISMWNQKLNSYINAYVKKRVFQKRREIEMTYKKMPRRQGFVKVGDPLKKGKRIKNDKLLINVAFYVDRSGSMYNTIDKVFDAAYTIAEALKRHFKSEKVVENVEFKMYTFDDKIEEIKWGHKVQARGGNLSMHQYLQKLEDLTGDYLVNVFITDGQFDINKNEVQNLLKKLGGCLVYVTNQGSSVMENLAKENDTQLFYILADENFTVEK